MPEVKLQWKYNGATADTFIQRKTERTTYKTDINMRHEIEKKPKTSNTLSFITICSLNSSSQRTGSLQRHYSGQQTVCPPTADSSPGIVLLNHSTQRQTSRHTLYMQRDDVARNKWYIAPLCSTTQWAMEQQAIESMIQAQLKKKKRGPVSRVGWYGRKT